MVISGRNLSLCWHTKDLLQAKLRSFCNSSATIPRSEARKERHELFLAEKTRQLRNIGLIEKIMVNVEGPPETCTLFMNKDVSTPHDCAKHINLQTLKHAGLAIVNEKVWDLHRPLTEDCDLKFLYYLDANPTQLNKAYWRSCSFLLGYMLETCIRDDVEVVLHSWPAVDYNTGSFVYDAVIGMEDWRPTKAELNIMGRLTSDKLRGKDLFFEPLDVDLPIAQMIFKHDKIKLAQLPRVAASYGSKGLVPLYCLGDHVDISRGPMISSTDQLGYFAVTNVHKVCTDAAVCGGPVYRAQGVSVPFTQKINSWTWQIVCDAAARPNELPFKQTELREAPTQTEEPEKIGADGSP